jgi:hypothetical protein
VARLEHAANDAFMPAFHAAAFVAAGMLILAVILFAVWLPQKPDTVDWEDTLQGAKPSTVDRQAPESSPQSSTRARPGYRSSP